MPSQSPTTDPDSPEALAISARLQSLIFDEIAVAGGWLRFARFMELALYAPGLGYYSAGAVKIGRHPGDGSDFVTAPELTPLFARAVARPVAAALADGGDTVLELGGGTGRLATDLLLALEALDALPTTYSILEVSADLRERQVATLERGAPHLRERVRWIDRLPERIDGVVVGNEVLDALPVDLVVWDGERWACRGVVQRSEALAFEERALTDDLVAAVRSAFPSPALLPRGYVSELSLASSALLATLVARMTAPSVALFVDYGFPRSEYYHPQRASGTLIAHRRHRTNHDVLAVPGLQDLTAHVDFSAAADTAVEGGGVVLGYTSQASFLIDCGIATLLSGDGSDAREWAPQAAALQTLLSEAEMGELFKVLAIGRRSRALPGFGGRSRVASL